MSAAVIRPYDPAWPGLAAAWLHRIQTSCAGLNGSPSFRYEHIGSTAVPGLAAKPIIDLQILTTPLPAAHELERALVPLGFAISTGSRPDSPGVYFDTPRPDTDQDPEKHRKHLFFTPGPQDGPAVILHVRRRDSPFGKYVTTFRDWLRASPDEARSYEAVKRSLAAQLGSAADYDGYTRAKTTFLDDAHARLVRWAASKGAPEHCA
ncbi:GrpB family protein [Arthrobacter sp. ATA002]|uniref:GrpB family protein n=1 Tax=Arthrobacter sp. ATA002 TaxID=2991715 RepID=UPI0022A7FDB4|nr:GrpB family protein [Arthrobacter sp. ATA002]WAP50533.1 GrpB family protein [Arthrobacter sp. ATA002]